MEDQPEGIVADVVHKPHRGCGAVNHRRHAVEEDASITATAPSQQQVPSN
jgi:hypothetical protein